MTLHVKWLFVLHFILITFTVLPVSPFCGPRICEVRRGGSLFLWRLAERSTQVESIPNANTARSASRTTTGARIAPTLFGNSFETETLLEPRQTGTKTVWNSFQSDPTIHRSRPTTTESSYRTNRNVFQDGLHTVESRFETPGSTIQVISSKDLELNQNSPSLNPPGQPSQDFVASSSMRSLRNQASRAKAVQSSSQNINSQRNFLSSGIESETIRSEKTAGYQTPARDKKARKDRKARTSKAKSRNAKRRRSGNHGPTADEWLNAEVQTPETASCLISKVWQKGVCKGYCSIMQIAPQISFNETDGLENEVDHCICRLDQTGPGCTRRLPQGSRTPLSAENKWIRLPNTIFRYNIQSLRAIYTVGSVEECKHLCERHNRNDRKSYHICGAVVYHVHEYYGGVCEVVTTKPVKQCAAGLATKQDWSVHYLRPKGSSCF